MKKSIRESFCGVLVLALTILGIVLFALNFSTGYYTFGQMNSGLVLTTALAAAVIECLALFCLKKYETKLWPKLLTFAVTALLAFAALTLVGDRVEGIGNCIITDYDSGHGGEEAIYMSLGAVLAWLAAMIFNIIGSFGKNEPMKASGKGILGCAAALVLLGILIPSLLLGGLFAPKAAQSGTGASAGNPAAASTYSIKLSGAEGNVDKVQDYQFQCGNLSGLMNYDTRLTLDLALTLNPDGTYALFSDAYCIEAGKRAVIGDDTGLGMVSVMNAEGTYTVNEDGTVTTSPASHAVFELALDTYSSQMRGPASYKLGDQEMADGKYDSAEYPVILESVPKTIWTLNSDKTIEAYVSAAPAEEAPAEEAAEAPAVEGVTIPSDDGGTEMTFNSDGTYRFWFGSYSIEDLGTYTYENGVLTLTDVNGKKSSGEGDPIKLHYTYSGSDQLTGDYTIPADSFHFGAEEPAPAEDSAAPAEKAGITAISDDHGTTLTLFNDGSYRFWFEPYSVEDLGSWQIADGVLTVTDKNGKETAAEGNPYRLHYTYSDSDQLTGDYTISADIFPFPVSGVSVPSDDTGTTITFFADGSYLFSFGSHSIVDLGTYTFENGVLTVTDVNGKESSGEGDPIKLHYTYSGSDQLTGDYTIPANSFLFD